MTSALWYVGAEKTWRKVGDLLDLVSPASCANSLRNAGYAFVRGSVPWDPPMRVTTTGRRRAAGIATGLVIAFLAILAFLPIQAWVLSGASALRDLGPAGAILFGAAFVMGTVAMLPASAFSLAAGLVYGPIGLGLAWLAMMIAGAASFALARNRLAPLVRDRIAAHRLASAAVRVVDEEGWRMVLLVRLSGIVPFGVQNYVFGVTGLGAGPFMAATAIGVVPSILISGGIGAFGHAASGEGLQDEARLAGAVLAIAAGLVVVAITARKIRAKLSL